MLVKPKRGLVLRDPDTMQLVPPEGIDVPENSPMWNRLIDTGDAVKVIAADPSPAKKGSEQ